MKGMESCAWLRRSIKVWILLFFLELLSVSCEEIPSPDVVREPAVVSLPELAQVFANLPLGQEHLEEVHAAVSSSVDNGYDEEYMLADLFNSPGAGVGSSGVDTRASEGRWERPIRSLLKDYLDQSFATRASSADYMSAEDYIAALTASDVQIYWPFADRWDGEEYPVITFDPGVDAASNEGYTMTPEGELKCVVVTEELARERPVWVINRNDDSMFKSIEMLRKEDPDWGKGGGIIVGPSTRAGTSSDVKTLFLESIKLKKNLDCWLAGGSELFVRCGSVENFKASTEAEMRLYSPSVTDFMIAIRRSQIGTAVPFDAVLVSEWTDQLQSLAFMITEDDGGTRTSWKCSATVKVESKSYGFDISLPMNSRDDIVWRGQLSRKYFEKNNKVEGHFGDADLIFAIQ